MNNTAKPSSSDILTVKVLNKDKTTSTVTMTRATYDRTVQRVPVCAQDVFLGQVVAVNGVPFAAENTF